MKTKTNMCQSGCLKGFLSLAQGDNSFVFIFIWVHSKYIFGISKLILLSWYIVSFATHLLGRTVGGESMKGIIAQEWN